MADVVVQASFNSGEWSPNLYARVDIAKYRSGAALLRNFFVDYRGGASTRSGTKYLIQAKDSTHPVRLIPFQASSTVGYICEFGHQYIRFIFDGAMVTETPIAITGATQANPCVLTIAASGYAAGDVIFISGVVGMVQLNNRYFQVLSVVGSSVTIGNLNGVGIDSTTYTAYTSGGTAARVYTIASPYSGADLQQLKFAQSINQMVIAHPLYAAQLLTENSATNWTISTITLGATIPAPTGLTFTTSLAAGTVNYGYLVTSIDAGNQESSPSAVLNIPNLQDMRVTNGTIQVSWTLVSGAVRYNIYKTTVSYVGAVPVGVIYGFIGFTSTTAFVDTNIAPDFTQTPPVHQNPFAFGNPAVVGFFQQRLVLGYLAPGGPQTLLFSKTGNFFNFDSSAIPKASDAITATLVSGVLNTIKSFVPSTSGLLVLTDRASWMVNGGSSGSAVTPSAIVANAQSFNGANDVPPIVANYDVLYVQEKGAAVRDLAFNIYFNVFTGTDISIVASHLFYSYQILQWAWAEEPFKVVWAVRNDGVMLTLTFLKEQDFVGWSHQDTPNGLFQSVAVVTESTPVAGFVDAVYTVVQRVINGNTVKYIERIADRIFPNGATDAWCVDAGIQYSGSPATNFSGAEHLAGQTVTGLADGNIIPPFVMPISGIFTLPSAAKVTIGLAFTCQLQTLALDIGEPSIQGKVKKIPGVVVRVNQTLGLTIGSQFTNQVPMKDLVVGNVSSMLTGQPIQTISGLTTGDAYTILDPTYTVPGQYCIQQNVPYPATVLGVFPRLAFEGDRS